MKKSITIALLGIIVLAIAGSCATSKAQRNLAYEQHCDSIWEADQDYYLDVLMETDEYCNYIDKFGPWWPEE